MARYVIAALLWKNSLFQFRDWPIFAAQIGIQLLLMVILITLQIYLKCEMKRMPIMNPENIHILNILNPFKETMTEMSNESNKKYEILKVNPKTQRFLIDISDYIHKENISETLTAEKHSLPNTQQNTNGLSPRLKALDFLLQSFPLYFYIFMMSTTSIVLLEMERKIKESMKLMEVKTFSYYLAWFIPSFISGFILCVIVTVGLSVPFPIGSYEPVLISDSLLILTVLTVYVMDLISFSFMISCFFAKTTAIRFVHADYHILVAAAVFLLEMYIVPLKFGRFESTLFAHMCGCLYFPSGITYFLQILLNTEEKNVGLTFNAMLTYEVYPHLNLLDTIIMMTTNMMFNFLLVWYFENIDNAESGLRRPYYFFITKDFWFPSFIESCEDITDLQSYDDRIYEQIPLSTQPVVQVRGLFKVLNRKIAVAGLRMDLYKDQITVLFGCEGSGKTTTINMITGFLKPDRGTAIINGHDVTKNLVAARKYIGLCPQYSVVYPLMTCYEQLQFYSKVRGRYDSRRTNKHIDELLEELGLTEQKDVYPISLNDGQKRKLTVACAFTEGNNIVILDEPSFGVDKRTRVDIWAFLKNRREGRAILLTTQDKDEAHCLGDRILFIAEGKVKCCGTSNFIKKFDDSSTSRD